MFVSHFCLLISACLSISEEAAEAVVLGVASTQSSSSSSSNSNVLVSSWKIECSNTESSCVNSRYVSELLYVESRPLSASYSKLSASSWC